MIPRKRLAVALAIGALLACAGTAYAVVSVSFSAKAKPARAGKPTGLYVSIRSSDPGAFQPPVMNRLAITLPGGKFNGKRFPHCNLEKLIAKGPKGCPRRSRIGKGSGVGMARPVVTDPVQGKLTLFNGNRRHGKDRIFVFVLPDLGPTFVSIGTIHKRHGKYRLDFNIPPIKTLPTAPDASVISVKTKTPRKRIVKRRHGKRHKYYLITAPRKCRHHKWRGSAKFYFVTGETVTAKFSQRCRRR